MSRPTNIERTEVQLALIRMREILGLTQQDLATALGKSAVTVARWETSHPPKGVALMLLIIFALKQSQHDQLPVKVFQKALWRPDESELRREAELTAASADFEAAAGHLCRNSDRTAMVRHWEKLCGVLNDGLAALIKSEQKRRFQNVTHIAEWQAIRERIQQTMKGKK